MLGAGTGALLMIRSDPGGGAPATNAAAMNDAGTRLTSRGVTFSALNADDGDDTPSHVLAQFMTAWNNATDVDGGGVTMDLGWIGVKFNG